MSHCTAPKKFQRSLLALAIATAFAPAWALDLASAPPGTTQPYVAPNVILSLDDSTSMNTTDMIPNKKGNYTKTRTEVLKDALTEVFEDHELVPNEKIRLAWQSMSNCTSVNGKKAGAQLTAASAESNKSINLMRILDDTHRNNFLTYVKNFNACGSTPTHFMVKGADEYMRAPLHKNGPWADNPGEQLASANNNNKPLGCRRNYHILLTDGGWNGTYNESDKINTDPINFDNQDSNNNTNGIAGTKKSTKKYPNFILPDGTKYLRSDPQTWIYRDIDYPTVIPNNESQWHPGYKNQFISTVSDWAFKSWADPLQPSSSLTGSISPLPAYDKAPPEETFTNRLTGKEVTLKKYWNPRHNPATWPHMITFTIGFSEDSLPIYHYRPVGTISGINPTWKNYIGKYDDSSIWSLEPLIDKNINNGRFVKPQEMLPYGFDGSFAEYALGEMQWFSAKRVNWNSSEATSSQQDMWHAAINGRGKFYAVEKGEDLKNAFRQIIQTINTDVEPDTTSTATSGSNISRNNIGKFTSNYEPKNAWKGFITAEKIKTDGTTEADWGGQNTAQKLDNRTLPRVILSWNEENKEGVTWQWNSLSSTQKLALQKNIEGIDEGENSGKYRLNYISGDRSKEGTEAPNGYSIQQPYRQRKSIQGDIVNSAVWYTSTPVSNYSFKGYSKFINDQKNRSSIIYVGGNDGMLHGFSAETGEEKIAYIPQGVIPKLNQLTDPNYNDRHRYFVDGSPMTGDVDVANIPSSSNDDSVTHTPDWRTLLVGSLGAGGKGYFVLDVTDPSGFATASPSQLVRLDRTRSSEANPLDCDLLTEIEKATCEQDRDIGHITAEPVKHSSNILQTTQMTFMNNNRWAVVMGNGYNSTNQRPVLLIQYLDGNQELKLIPATTDTPNSGKAKDNGLSAPRLVDINSDGRVDIAYAGDNLGNMWKFDLTSYSHDNWTVAFNGNPLFTAKGPTFYESTDHDNIPQPITVAPTIRPNDRKMEVGTGTNKRTVSVGGMMIAFGTGRNIAQSDPQNNTVQTLYGVLDNTRYKYRNTNPKRLEIHPGNSCEITDTSGCIHIPAPESLGEGVNNANNSAKLAKLKFEEVSGANGSKTVAVDALTPANWNERKGWYIDLPETRERLLKNMEFYDGSNILVAYSQVPAKGSNIRTNIESCETDSVDEERQYRTFLNIMDGSAPSIQLMAIIGDFGDTIFSRKKVSKGAHQIINKDNEQNYDIDTKNQKEELNRMPETTSRPSWRQMQ